MANKRKNIIRPLRLYIDKNTGKKYIMIKNKRMYIKTDLDGKRLLKVVVNNFLTETKRMVRRKPQAKYTKAKGLLLGNIEASSKVMQNELLRRLSPEAPPNDNYQIEFLKDEIKNLRKGQLLLTPANYNNPNILTLNAPPTANDGNNVITLNKKDFNRGLQQIADDKNLTNEKYNEMFLKVQEIDDRIHQEELNRTEKETTIKNQKKRNKAIKVIDNKIKQEEKEKESILKAMKVEVAKIEENNTRSVTAKAKKGKNIPEVISNIIPNVNKMEVIDIIPETLKKNSKTIENINNEIAKITEEENLQNQQNNDFLANIVKNIPKGKLKEELIEEIPNDVEVKGKIGRPIGKRKMGRKDPIDILPFIPFSGLDQDLNDNNTNDNNTNDNNTNENTDVTIKPKGGKGDSNKTDSKGLWSDQIERIMEPYYKYGFKGCFPIDKINTIQLRKIPQDQISFIMNLSPSYKVGTHWVAVMLNLKDRSLEYFDPLGNGPSRMFFREIKKLIDRLHLPYYLKCKINKIKHQIDSDNCGWHCIKFLTDMYAGKEFKEVTGYSIVRKAEKAVNILKHQNGFGFI